MGSEMCIRDRYQKTIIPWIIVWHCLRNPTFSRFSRTPTCDRQTDRQTHRQTDKPVGFYGPIAPPGLNAPNSECPPNVVPNSEFRTRPDAEFPNALHSEFINTPNVDFLNVPVCSAHVIPCWQQMGSSAVLRARRSALVLAESTRCLRWAHSIGRGCRVHTCVMAIGSSVSFVQIESIFLQYTGDTDAKNDGAEF